MRRGGRPAAPSVLATAAKLITAQHSLAPPPPSPSLSGGGGVIHRPSKRVGHIFREWNRGRDGRVVGAEEGGGGRKENRDFQLNVRLLPDQQQLSSHFADKNRGDGDGKSGCSKQIVVILAPRKETGRPTQQDTRCRDELTICPRRIFFELTNVFLRGSYSLGERAKDSPEGAVSWTSPFATSAPVHFKRLFRGVAMIHVD